MKNRIKSGLLFISLVVLPFCCSAQTPERYRTIEPQKFDNTFISPVLPLTFNLQLRRPISRQTPLDYISSNTKLEREVIVSKRKNKDSRFRKIPSSVQATQVITVAHPDAVLYDIYHVYKEGSVVYKSIKGVAPSNRFNSIQPNDAYNIPPHDSFNPYGARTFKEAMWFGLFGLLGGN